jgi:hypothetical protein
MAARLIGRLASLLIVAFVLFGICNGKETMGERAQSVRGRRAKIAQSQRTDCKLGESRHIAF